MGRGVPSRETYRAAVKTHADTKGPVTSVAKQQAYDTGKLNPLVDPAGYGVVRRSLLRFEQQSNGQWLLTIGTSVPIETRVDTTGSMGDNVDIAMRVLPNLFEACGKFLPGYDPHYATGIFNDVGDRFVLCRPQFEAEAEKIVKQLTLMVPIGQGGDFEEDPHYGLFGAAYLVAAYINRIGLKSYDFTISDASARDRLDERQLVRIFGDEVFAKVKENGWQVDKNDLPSTKEVVQHLLTRAHAFFLQVGDSPETTQFWTEIFGPERVVKLPSTEVAPLVQAVIIGLTEGTLQLGDTVAFLRENNIDATTAKMIERSVANIPLGAQAALPNYSRRPQAGDLFAEKTDLWPIGHSDVDSAVSELQTADKPVADPDWL